jgi:ABC-type glycerol-3-phosphate transport system substrate-binding protein
MGDLFEWVEAKRRIVLIQDAYHTFGFFTAFGGQLMDGTGKCIADQGGFSEVMQFLLDLEEADPPWLWGDTNVVLKEFWDGKAATVIDGPESLAGSRNALGEKP